MSVYPEICYYVCVYTLLNMDNYKTTDSGIQVHKHHLFIPGSKSLGIPPVTIREQVISKYTEFLRSWEIGASQSVNNPSSSFASLWVGDSVFRSSMLKALSALGVEDPDNLRVTHLTELLISASLDGDTRPLLFQLHSDTPDPKRLGEVLRVTQERKTAPRSTWKSRFSTLLRSSSKM